MGSKLAKATLTAVLTGTVFVGCQSANHRPYSEDPLLLSKKPVEGKVDDSKPVQLALGEPTPPASPSLALANGQARSQSLDLAEAMPGGTNRDTSAKMPVKAMPAVRTKVSSEAQAVPAVRREIAGDYGHASDYTWLQGVLDKHYHGHLNLRYCDPTMDDNWGGKVRLEPDPRLAQFKAGDVLMIDGMIVAPSNPASGNWHHYPLFRITNVKLIRSAGE